MAKQYSNRSDLRNPAGKIAKQAATGQPYGEAAKQMDAQSMVPMGAAPTDAPMAQSGPRPTPGSVVDLNAPTERPDQPMNDGYTSPTPGIPYSFGDPILDEMKQLYYMYPNDDLAQLISAYDRYFR